MPPGRALRYLQHARLHLGHGQPGFTMFNTIVPPNSTQYPWNGCSFIGSGTGGVPGWPNAANGLNFANASSKHPGGANVMFGDGSVKFIKSIDRHDDLVGARNPRRRRSDQLGCLLTRPTGER